jgi:ATP synthase protein I
MAPKDPNALKRPGGEPSAASLDERLRKLSREIEAESAQAHGAAGEFPSSSDKAARGYGKAARLASEFVAGILVGGFLGWAFDQLLGTSPIGLIVFIFLGFGAGFMNMVRAGRQAMRDEENETKNG